MDAFFDKLKLHANKAKVGAVKIGKQAYEKTSNVLNQTKLNFTISETENKVRDVYCEIGQTVYESYIANGCEDETFGELCAKIDNLMTEIESLREKVAELKADVKCAECGAYNKENAVFCSKCGAKLNEQREDTAPEADAEDSDDESARKVFTIKPKHLQDDDLD